MTNHAHALNIHHRKGRGILIPLFIILLALAGCGKPDNPSSQSNNSGSAFQELPAENSSGYLDAKGWDLAQAEIKTIEKTIEAFNAFYDVWGWAYEHRVFQRFKEAIETAAYLPGKLDEAEKIAQSIKQVKGYPEIDNIKKCYMEMIPLLRSGAQNMADSLVAARDGKIADEKSRVQAYRENWKSAMDFSKKSFEYMQQLLTRGSRVESQKLTSGQNTAQFNLAEFKKAIRQFASEYDKQIMEKITAIKKLAASSQWELAIARTNDVYLALQSSIMKAGQINQGTEKSTWDTRQELVTTLASQMMAMKKFSEYLEASQRGDKDEAAKLLKVYDIMYKSASDSRSKLRKLGY